MILRTALRRFARLALIVAAVFALAGARPAAAQAANGEALAAADVAAGSAGGAAGEGVGASPPATATRPVAARDLERGELLTAADIRYEPAPDGGDPEAPATLVGWRTRRVISAGEMLRAPAVSPPELVRAGETVEAVYSGRSVVLRVTGTAMGSGAMGERVLVRVDARRRLEGVVIGPALVQLDSNVRR